MRRHALSLFLLVFCAHAYFVSALGGNQAARIGAILTFVEPGPNASRVFGGWTTALLRSTREPGRRS